MNSEDRLEAIERRLEAIEACLDSPRRSGPAIFPPRVPAPPPGKIEDTLATIEQLALTNRRTNGARSLTDAVAAGILDDATAVRLLDFWYPEA